MYSNFSSSVWALVLTANLFSCGLKLQEKPRVQDVVELKNSTPQTIQELGKVNGNDCFSEANSQIEKFVDGVATDEGIEGALNCYSKAIITFRDYVRGEKPWYFSEDEIQFFIQHNFLKDKKFVLTNELSEEIFKLKVVLVGGTRFGITTDELTLLSEKLKGTGKDLAALNSWMPIISGMDQFRLQSLRDNPESINTVFNLAQNAFRQFLVSFTRHFENPDYFYRQMELYNLLEAALKANQSSSKTLSQMADLKPLVLGSLQVLTESELVLGESEWKDMLGLLGDIYMSHRRYSLVSNEEAKTEGYNYLALKGAAIGLEKTLSKLIAAKKFRGISRQEIVRLMTDARAVFASENLVNSKGALDWLNKILALSPNNQKMLFDVMWSHIFNSIDNRILGQPTSGLDGTAVRTFVEELSHLFQTQFELKNKYQNLLSRNNVVTKAILKSELDVVGLSELSNVYQSQAVHVFDQNDYLKILDPDVLTDAAPVSWDDVQRSNFARVGARLVIRSFSKESERANRITHILRDEVIEGWSLLRPVMVELDLVDEDNKTFITSRFRESDLFVSSANGDSLAQYAEIHDLVLHILSGLKRGDTLKIDQVFKCVDPSTNPDDIKSKFRISEQCALDSLATNSAGFQSLPVFLQFRGDLTRAEQDTYATAMLKAAGYVQDARQKDPTKRTIPFGDLKLYPHIVQYIEMIFFKFDMNRDAKFDLAEAEMAWPIFRATFNDVIKKIGQEDIFPTEDRRKGLFLFLLHNGGFCRTPVSCKETFPKFLDQPESRVILESNRIKLGQLFNVMADALNK